MITDIPHKHDVMTSVHPSTIQGGWIIYFGKSFSVSMDMVNGFWKIVFHFDGL